MQIPLWRIRSMRLPHFKTASVIRLSWDHFTLCVSPLPPTSGIVRRRQEQSLCHYDSLPSVYGYPFLLCSRKIWPGAAMHKIQPPRVCSSGRMSHDTHSPSTDTVHSVRVCRRVRIRIKLTLEISR